MKSKLVAALFASAFAGAALAAVSADEAKKLGGPVLTEFGAERAGNKEGTIPPYNPKGVKVVSPDPKNDPGQTRDPYNEKPLFTITAQNYQKYADKLDGQVELFKKYPNYRMDIYPSHRDYIYPKAVLDNTLKNATECKGVKDDLKLEGCYAGWPFPIPKTGRQAMWNKLLNYQGQAWSSPTHCITVNPNGTQTLQTYSFAQQESPVYFTQNMNKVLPSNVVYWRIIQHNLGPARKVGEKLLFLDSMDMVDVGRRVWTYVPGQRRVKLAPDLAYDTPSPNSAGASTMDDAKGFLGAMDRFDFKLVGKKEKYILYNTFMANDHTVCPDEKVHGNTYFPLPDCMRWELHRVWVVEATLKPQFRHIYSKRIFFLDEDSPGANSLEDYDGASKLYRIGFQQSLPFSNEVGGGSFDNTYMMDLQTGIWASQGATGFKGSGWVMGKPWDDIKFSPEAIAGEGIR